MLPDEELRAFARSDASETRSVLIEVEAPEPRVEVRREVGREGPAKRRALTPSDEQRELVATRLAELAETVEKLTGRAPRVLRAAHALVADLTAEQLRAVSRNELTRAVRPNRRRGAR